MYHLVCGQMLMKVDDNKKVCYCNRQKVLPIQYCPCGERTLDKYSNAADSGSIPFLLCLQKFNTNVARILDTYSVSLLDRGSKSFPPFWLQYFKTSISLKLLNQTDMFHIPYK